MLDQSEDTVGSNVQVYRMSNRSGCSGSESDGHTVGSPRIVLVGVEKEALGPVCHPRLLYDPFCHSCNIELCCNHLSEFAHPEFEGARSQMQFWNPLN